MRRHLLLVRHAKSAWDDPTLTDHDRPLAPRGHKAVHRIRGYFELAAHAPDVVLCSSSRRTIETFEGFRSALPPRTTTEITEEIYEASADTLLSMLRRLDTDTAVAMMIGHNPGTQDLAARLAGSGDVAELTQIATKLPTGAVVALSFDGAWSELDDGVARVDDLFMPRPPRP